MSIGTMDAAALRKCFFSAAGCLNQNKEIINELNVFPVPDGDTGTNMSMTILSAAKEVSALPENADMAQICKAISSGSLRGARGNSGVILSQLLRGFTKVAAEHRELTAPVLSAAFNKGVETAYKAVMKPKEGTILTVARGIAEKMSELSEEKELTLAEVAEQILSHGEEVLAQTPELLPVLKEAGVVDSGGRGLVECIRGACLALQGKDVPLNVSAAPSGAPSSRVSPNREVVAAADIKFGYCTEFILQLNRVFNARNEADFKAFLESVGDSIVCVAMDDIVKVHVHTNHPGRVFEEGLKYGSLTNMKIDNMREEHNERLFHMEKGGGYQEISGEKAAAPQSPAGVSPEVHAAPAPEAAPPVQKPYGFITVAAGQGLVEIFKGLGADEVIEGGQTMNPSTEDILNAMERIPADTVFILPNNPNVILAANQAANLSKEKKAVVIPTRSIPQGITALINFIPDHTPEENEQEMKASLATVSTGEVTYAVRDTEIDGHVIHEGDIMGIGDHSILAVGQDLTQTVAAMTEAMTGEESELITLYYGDQIQPEDAEALGEVLREKHPSLDVDVQEGGQPVYYYIVSVE